MPTRTMRAVRPDPSGARLEVRLTRDADPRRWQADVRTPGGTWVRLHSARDPLAEARALLADHDEAVTSSGGLVIVGSGLGYLVEAASSAYPNARIVVIELAPELLAAANERAPELGRAPRVHMVCADDQAQMRELWRAFDSDEDREPPIVVHPVVARLPSVGLEPLIADVRRAIFSGRANARARRDHSGRYLLNTLRNLQALTASADVSALFGRFTGTPVVLVAAGPSLDRNIEELAPVADRVLVIAVDTALRPLLARGIAPHLCVALDPSELNARHLLHLPPCPHTTLIAEPSVDPQALAAFAGRLVTFRVADHHPWPWLRSQGLDRALLNVWGSVLTAAFDLALQAGCDPIAFAGADLAFTGERTYCRGTVWEEDWARHAGSGCALDEIWRADVRRRPTVRARDIAGGEVDTASHLISFRDWIVDRAARTGRTVVNTTGAGILHGPAVRQQTLSDFAREHAGRTRVSFRARWRINPAEAGSHQDFGSHEAGVPLHPKPSDSDIEEWQAFARVSTDGLNAALAAAPIAFEGPANAERMLEGLPERTLELRDALKHGFPGGGTAAARDLGVALDAAARLLESPRAIVESHVGTPNPLEPVWSQFRWHEHCADDALRFHRGAAALARAGKRRPLPQDDYLLGPRRSGTHTATADTSARMLIALQAMWLHPHSATDSLRRLEMRLLARAVTLTGRGDALDAGHAPDGHQLSAHDAIVAVTGLVAGAPFAPDLGGDIIARLLQSPPPASPAQGVEDWLEFIEPVPLALRGLPPCYCGYIHDERHAVFASAGLPHAFYVREDGEIERGAAWPGAISGQIPWGSNGGALAWHAYAPHRIMLRDSGDGPIATYDIPFAAFRVLVEPDGTTLWASYDGGLWSWRPEQGPTLLASTPPVIGIRRAGSAVRLDPVLRTPDGRFCYEPPASALSWDPGPRRLTTEPLDAAGPCWSESTAHGWTARVFDLTDRIGLEHRDGRCLWLACETPTSVAWAGRSLVVNTRVGDVLLFPLLADCLRGCTAGDDESAPRAERPRPEILG